jgi:hypothetical protein
MHDGAAEVRVHRRVRAWISRCFVCGCKVNRVEAVPAFFDEGADGGDCGAILGRLWVFEVGAWKETRAEASVACAASRSPGNGTEVCVGVPEEGVGVNEGDSCLVQISNKRKDQSGHFFGSQAGLRDLAAYAERAFWLSGTRSSCAYGIFHYTFSVVDA